jgi:hypothetical protein
MTKYPAFVCRTGMQYLLEVEADNHAFTIRHLLRGAYDSE